MRQYLNTLIIASLTFCVGNLVGQAVDSMIFRDSYSQKISEPIKAENSENVLCYLSALGH